MLNKGQTAIEYTIIGLLIISIIVSGVSLAMVSGVSVPKNTATTKDVNQASSRLKGKISSLGDRISTLEDRISSLEKKVTGKAPAKLIVSSINAPPANTGEKTTISVTVLNTGGKEGTKDITLTVAGKEVGTQSVTVPAGGSRTITFTAKKEEAGDYQVKAGRQTATWSVTGGKPKLSGSINVMVWEGYGPIIKNFNKKHPKATVNYSRFSSSGKAFTKWKAGGYKKFDIVLPNVNWVRKFYEADLIRPIDRTNVPNYKDVIPALKGKFEFNGKLYGVPIRYGIYGIAYNSKYVSEEEAQSWDVLWDEKYKGKIGMYNNYMKSIACTAMRLGYRDQLAKGKYFELSDKAFKDVKDALISQAKNLNVMYYTADPTERKWFAGGQLWVGLAGRNDTLPLQIEKTGKYVEGMDWTVPKEGALSWWEGAIISKACDNPRLAEAFINYLISPKAGAQLAKEDLAPSANKYAKRYYTEKEMDLFYTPPEKLKRTVPYKAIKNVQRWKDLWSKVKAAAG